jgi:predicted transcriptional regulator/transcriptional regulator with XRE-family HTH domain
MEKRARRAGTPATTPAPLGRGNGGRGPSAVDGGSGSSRLGGKVRALRRKEGLSQTQLAERLAISPSYLNLIENNRRPLPAALLIRLAQLFELDMAAFASDGDGRLVGELLELFSDPVFDAHALNSVDIRDLAQNNTAAAVAVVGLYRRYQEAREAAETLAERLTDGDVTGGAAGSGDASRSRLPSEEVSDLVQSHMNHFPALEEGAERVWKDGKLVAESLYAGLTAYLLKKHGVHTTVARWGVERGVVRRFDPESKVLTLSELLPTRSRNFQLAHQIGLFTMRRELDVLTNDPALSTEESRTMARIALANYFAAAVLMPYAPFLKAAREERYDIDVVGRRFRVGFEHVCHRVTTLRRPGAEGVPFHMIRIDVAGNISKRFSASGIQFARFSGACPRWNIFSAFQTPGMIRIQISRMTDGSTFFCIARTVQKDSHGYHAQPMIHVVGLGCRVEQAGALVYADGIDLEKRGVVVDVGVTCRICERNDCEQRAFPSMRQPLVLDENLRGLSLYSGPRPA